ncbi:MAG: tRNA (adenosine(37)-N6)-threonylcarbamoyltransferase complex ATPase subunit type 1 TsaE [Opitutales bacterium]|nr:tRNA (adenosine(37)-N6)-threonylcarbamoyltransferase complex ATPase subunit type 1 TsaE [Opitutales bacterium]MBT6769621.1 tRNA (adenosine(37)-N6)-threonylcarbamoyltransferase complex ATPase subunit type 1 TsaE [Opitutales bacterium]MBT7867502.1 tRNA (adenosine(37)-N6)-threonylcarbamoyltransferase complex ATPase subunit type 1 TsaE [Opitutales bacterium]MDG2255209.1 tRNA (adenosine(37)-N6)-threonylcarbamoyltransferase complex ATPase subunit type 1 TsaE [Opitutaceae bacterium]
MNIFDRLNSGIETRSPDETITIATLLAEALPTEAILTLEGELGAGKTTFVKGLAQAMGIQELITSPTFNIFNTYDSGIKTLIHMDAYRLNPDSNAIDELMLEDFMTPPYCLAIEWPSNLGELPWPTTLPLEFTISRDEKHRIQSIAK